MVDVGNSGELITFRNDGTDDLIIRAVSTEQLTAWKIEDGRVTGTLALA